MTRGEQKDRIYKWLQETKVPDDMDEPSSFDCNNRENRFSDDEALTASILYHPDFAEWACVEDLKRQIELESEGTFDLFSVLEQAQSSLSRFMSEKILYQAREHCF